MTVSTVNFVPSNQRQVKELVQYIKSNKPAIEARKQQPAYQQRVKQVQEVMRAYYAVNPAQRVIKGQCPWVIVGARDMCTAIARDFDVPSWDVFADANPSV